jgi:SPP1 family predicted phage head-tail adaptor
MILPIGKLDRRITIQSLTQEQGADYGEPTESWDDWATVWANVYSGAGRELEAARQVTAEIDTQFQIRWIEGLTPTMRILYEGRVYDIHRIQEVGRRERWNIYAKARQE